MGDRPNIVWITLESVRADRTTLDGYRRETTPNLRRIVEAGGRWFPRCYSEAHWTPAVSASILTGTHLTTHGVGFDDTTNVSTIPEDLHTVPELLSADGYTTACFSSNPYVGPAAGFDRGFDRFHGVPTRSDVLSRTGARCGLRYLRHVGEFGAGTTTAIERHKDCIYPLYQTEVLREWLTELTTASDPLFLYTHFNSSHHPYNPPLRVLDQFLDYPGLSPERAIEIAREITDNIWREIADECSFTDRESAALQAVYDAEIAYVDLLVGHLFDTIRREAPDNTILVVTGDHGELFGEAGVLGHNLVLHDALVRVPTVTWGLGDDALHVDGPTQHLDVVRTAMASAGVPTEQFQGYDLRTDRREYALIQRGPRESDLESIRQYDPPFDVDRYHAGPVDCLRSTRWKLVRSAEGAALYEPPDESTDYADQYPETAAAMETELTARRPDGTDRAGDRAQFTEATRQRLDDLGYI